MNNTKIIVMKINVISLFCFIGFMSLMSCSSEQEQTAISAGENQIIKTETFAQLNVQLKAYNEQFGEHKFDRTHTRGFFGKLWKVVKADFYGGLAGGGLVAAGSIDSGYSFGTIARGVGAGALVGAVLGSLYESLNIIDSQSGSIKIVNKALPCGSVGLCRSDSVGYYHNVIIQEIINENPFLSLKDTLKMHRFVEKKIYEIGDVSKQEIKEATESYLNVRSGVKVVDSQELKRKLPQLKDEIDIAELYFENVSCLTNEEDVKEYTKGVRNIVAESKVPVESKCILNSSTSVAMNSYMLWKIAE